MRTVLEFSPIGSKKLKLWGHQKYPQIWNLNFVLSNEGQSLRNFNLKLSFHAKKIFNRLMSIFKCKKPKISLFFFRVETSNVRVHDCDASLGVQYIANQKTDFPFPNFFEKKKTNRDVGTPKFSAISEVSPPSPKWQKSITHSKLRWCAIVIHCWQRNNVSQSRRFGTRRFGTDSSRRT